MDTDFWCKIAQYQALTTFRTQRGIIVESWRIVYLTRWIIFEAAVLGNISDTMPRWACTQSCLFPLFEGLNLESIVCTTYLPIYQNFEAALSMRNIDTNFRCKIDGVSPQLRGRESYSTIWGKVRYWLTWHHRQCQLFIPLADPQTGPASQVLDSNRSLRGCLSSPKVSSRTWCTTCHRWMTTSSSEEYSWRQDRRAPLRTWWPDTHASGLSYARANRESEEAQALWRPRNVSQTWIALRMVRRNLVPRIPYTKVEGNPPIWIAQTMFDIAMTPPSLRIWKVHYSSTRST